jgi:hypothetical protein
MKKIISIALLLLSTANFATESNRELFQKSRPATFTDILNIDAIYPEEDKSALWQCGKIKLNLKKINHHSYWNSQSVVNFFYDDNSFNELIGVDDLSQKSMVVRITDSGQPILEFSGFRSKRDIKRGIPTSLVFAGLTAITYETCEEVE